ncbi:MAG: hypothetical protein JEZ00_15955 [Anaerolineaceae bacterium]|nr:hypothetical protein [Anaerolineaceae bacterium]
MSTANKKTSSTVKILLTFMSITGILGLWIVFASKAQIDTAAAYEQPQPVVSGEIYFPEMPTLMPIVDLNQHMVQSQPTQTQQELRSVSVPTPLVQQSVPSVGIQSIIIGNPSGGNSSSSGGGASSAAAPSTSTKTS